MVLSVHVVTLVIDFRIDTSTFSKHSRTLFLKASQLVAPEHHFKASSGAHCNGKTSGLSAP